MKYSSRLYQVILASSGVVFFTALGPGLYSDGNLAEWFLSWQKQAFAVLCHQMPDRSIMLGSMPMAVCSRCFGIYTAAFVTLVILPIIPQSDWRNRWAIALVLIAVLINGLEYGFNAFQIWENSLSSRFLSGITFGATAIFLLGTDKPQSIMEIMRYGNTTK